MKSDRKKTSPARWRARPLLLAAAGSATLLMGGCVFVSSGNLMAPDYDLASPDLTKPDLSPTVPVDAAVPDGGAPDAPLDAALGDAADGGGD